VTGDGTAPVDLAEDLGLAPCLDVAPGGVRTLLSPGLCEVCGRPLSTTALCFRPRRSDEPCHDRCVTAFFAQRRLPLPGALRVCGAT
jgi:hypothetical protein